MTDNEIIETVAILWVASGCDSDGFSYAYRGIMDRIKELELAEEIR